MRNTISFIYLFAAGVICFSGCKKKDSQPENEAPSTPVSSPLATLTTNTTVAKLNDSTIICSGNVSALGSSSVTAAGLCWNVQSGPTLSNWYTVTAASIKSGQGTFSDTLTGLEQNTTYYVRAYATNASGTTYGDEISITTSGTSRWRKAGYLELADRIILCTSTSKGKVYAGTSQGAFVSVNQGISWSTIGLSGEEVHKIFEFNNMLFAIVPGTGTFRLHQSADKGATWQISQNFPASVTVMTDIDVTPTRIFITTNTSAFSSADGITWVAVKDGGMLPAGSSGGQAGGVISLEVSGQNVYALSRSKVSNSIYQTLHLYNTVENSWDDYFFAIDAHSPAGIHGTPNALYLTQDFQSYQVSNDNLLPIQGLPLSDYSFYTSGSATLAGDGTDFYINTNGTVWTQLSKTGLPAGNNSRCILAGNYVLVHRPDGIYRFKY